LRQIEITTVGLWLCADLHIGDSTESRFSGADEVFGRVDETCRSAFAEDRCWL